MWLNETLVEAKINVITFKRKYYTTSKNIYISRKAQTSKNYLILQELIS